MIETLEEREEGVAWFENNLKVAISNYNKALGKAIRARTENGKLKAHKTMDLEWRELVHFRIEGLDVPKGTPLGREVFVTYDQTIEASKLIA